MTTKQEAVVKALARGTGDVDYPEDIYAARWWTNPRNGEERLYLNYRKDVKVYVVFDDAGELAGAALRVYVDDCGQHGNWYAAEKQKAAKWAAAAMLAIIAASSPETAADLKAELAGADPQHVGDMIADGNGDGPRT